MEYENNTDYCLECKNRVKCEKRFCMGFEKEEDPKINKELLFDYIDKDIYKINVGKVNTDNSVDITLIFNKHKYLDHIAKLMADELTLLLDKRYGLPINGDMNDNMANLLSVSLYQYFEDNNINMEKALLNK